jgi:uncharacterized membrane protein YfcA
LAKLPRHYYWLLIPALLGGVTGAYILSRTSNTQFGKLSPFFLLFALVLLILQPLLHRWLFSKQGLALERKHRWAVMGVVAVLFFMVATYGGYFGAGYGIITLAFLSLTELHDINQMNGLKNLGAICLGITAIAYLLTKNLIDLSLVPWVVTGNLLGGYLGATYSSKLSRRAIRTLVIVIGAVITALLFRKYH